jgi:hypothetical protein
MNQQGTPSNTSAPVFTPFWPVFLLAVSLAIFLGWQTTQAIRQHMASLRLADQQAVLAGRAAQTEASLQAMMMDLLKLSQTDADAKAIVARYGIKFNPPAQPQAQPGALPVEAVVPKAPPPAAAE